MGNSKNSISKDNAPYKIINNWYSLRFMLVALFIMAIMFIIKIFIFDLPSIFLLIPILMGWGGFIYSFIDSTRRDK